MKSSKARAPRAGGISKALRPIARRLGYQPTTARRRPPPDETAKSVVRTFTFPGVCSTDCYPVAISVPRIAAIHGEFAA